MKLMRLAITCWIGLVLGVAAHEFGRAAASTTGSSVVRCESDDLFPTCKKALEGKGPCTDEAPDSFCCTMSGNYYAGATEGKWCACIAIRKSGERQEIIIFYRA